MRDALMVAEVYSVKMVNSQVTPQVEKLVLGTRNLEASAAAFGVQNTQCEQTLQTQSPHNHPQVISYVGFTINTSNHLSAACFFWHFLG
jgi:hypothetical protein